VNGQIEHVIQVVDGFERKNLAFRQAQSAGVLHDRRRDRKRSTAGRCSLPISRKRR
jgi:hypothetical protein